MFSKTNLIATLVTALWGFLGGWLLWGLIGEPMLEDHTLIAGLMRDMPNMVILGIGCLIGGFAFSTIYSKWARGTHNVSHGAQFGIWLALLIGLGGGLIDHATSNLLDLSGTIINAIIYIVFYIIMGILASLVYSKFSGSE
ncbi:hypothetical protein [Changchengzhania lutea]|uniref:hypothetical protein n=1 Tax=Changchengzhania lutea TaxID=2049305 RepID=UPI00115D7293|nr:hypothetical protein [Changchengzhania lutea]